MAVQQITHKKIIKYDTNSPNFKAAPKEEKAVMKKKAELEEEVDTAEASEEVLESVEEPSEVAVAEAMGEGDPAESLRAVASEWLGSVLKTNNKS